MAAHATLHASRVVCLLGSCNRSDQKACAAAADANILVNKCRLAAQQYQLAYQEPMPVEQLVRSLCDNKQGYTQFGGLRPFGVSLLYGGW